MKRLKSTSDIIRTSGCVTIPYFETGGDVEDWINSLPVDLSAMENDQGCYLMLLGYAMFLDSTGDTPTSYPLCVVVGEAMQKLKDSKGNTYIRLRDAKGMTFDTTPPTWMTVENGTGDCYIRNDGGSVYIATSPED